MATLGKRARSGQTHKTIASRRPWRVDKRSKSRIEAVRSTTRLVASAPTGSNNCRMSEAVQTCQESLAPWRSLGLPVGIFGYKDDRPAEPWARPRIALNEAIVNSSPRAVLSAIAPERNEVRLACPMLQTPYSNESLIFSEIVGLVCKGSNQRLTKRSSPQGEFRSQVTTIAVACPSQSAQ
jgi:hypothetical protein